MKKIILLILLSVMMLIIGCQKPAIEVPSNIFSPKDVKVGDEVAGMKIVGLKLGEYGPDYDVMAAFEGKTVISGKFVQYENHDFLGNAISFEVDKESAKKLPILTYDERNSWFVFRNREEAIKLLEDYENEGLTIEIDNYTINYAHTEVFNEASITRVIEGIKKVTTSPDNSKIAVFRNDEYGISLEYPSNWKVNNAYSPGRYEGNDGYFQVSAIAGGQSNIDEVASSDANHKLLPYGSTPTIESLIISGQEARLIIPSLDQPTDMNKQASLIIKYPNSIIVNGETYKYFQLWSDKEHIRKIGETIKFVK
jgi:hypothetical protein